jgi:SHAQKYF class myb-like DNA-binding protein
MQQVSRKLDPVCLDQTKFKNSNKKFLSENKPSNSKKKSNFHKSDRIIFGLIREDSPCEQRKLIYKISNDSSVGKINIGRRKKNDSSFNRGRWHAEEHQRFIEGLLEYGNDWKNVQKFVGSRSSTQARSHAQKFFVKIGKTQIENLNLDFENNSLKSLNIMASKLNSDQLSRAIKNLNELVFDRKNSGRKNAKFEKNQKFEISEDTEFEKSLQIKNLSEIVQNFSSFSQGGLFPEKKKNQCQSSSFDNPIKFTLIKK